MRRLGIVLAVAVGLVVALVLAAWVVLQRIDWNTYKPPIAQAALDATGRRLDLAGDIAIEIGLRPGVRIEGVGFENAAWGSRPQMVVAERIVVRLELLPLFSGDVVVDRVELVGLDVLLETRADGTPNWEFETGTTPSGEAPSPPAEEPGEPLTALVREALVENARITIADRGTGGEQRLTVERLHLQMDGDAASLELAAAVDDAPLRITGSLAGVPEVASGGPLGLDLDVEAGGAAFAIEGRIETPLEATGIDLRLDGGGQRLAALGPLSGSELPDLGPYALKVRVRGGGDAYELSDLSLSLGSSAIAGSARANLAGARPRVDATLKSPRIDLADFQDATAAGEGAQANAAPAPSDERLFSAEPLALDGLGAVDARIRLDAALVNTGDVALSDVVLDLKLESRRLEIRQLDARFEGRPARVALTLDASRSTPLLDLSVALEGVEAGQLARTQGSEVLSGGPLHAALKVRGQGRSVRDIMASLGGDLDVDMGKAVIHQKWAGIALSDVKTTLTAAATGAGAEVNCVLAEFAIEGGVARPEVLVANLGTLALFGDGKVDLRKEKLSLSFERQALALSASGVLPPFEIKGALASPEARLDPGAVAGRAVDLAAVLLGDKDDRKEAKQQQKQDRDTLQAAAALGCRELHASYREARKRRGSTEGVALDSAAEKLGVDARDAEAGKRVLEGLKGILKR